MTGTADRRNRLQAGVTDTEPSVVDLDGSAACAEALTVLLTRSRRRVRIYSQHLARAIYHQEDCVDALSQFARRSRYARVEILIADSDPLLRQPHRLLPLTQRLNSRISLHKIQNSSEPGNWEFAIADDRQSLLIADANKWIGQYRGDDPVRNRKLQDVFEQNWLNARPDPSLRQFVL
ncbi:hypothetical protein HXX02_12870 [Microbulbifer elongatus]|uniref:DUF7931 domain-containing protein n=1 Tax=Microbulbifer elongatus TaxID=86173 RepID=A0ABT1P2J4_9GAMM|nr:hypothetical protein [Microbulbifer elongatus]MCQ3830340.1 hypothetical protein [Microbulbifer elongatus]